MRTKTETNTTKTKTTMRKYWGKIKRDDDDNDGDEDSEDEDGDAKIPAENDVISRPSRSNIIFSLCFPKQDGADGEEERTRGEGGG